MPKAGFEPARPCGHCALNAARLPVPPLRHKSKNMLKAQLIYTLPKNYQAKSYCWTEVDISKRTMRLLSVSAT